HRALARDCRLQYVGRCCEGGICGGRGVVDLPAHLRRAGSRRGHSEMEVHMRLLAGCLTLAFTIVLPAAVSADPQSDFDGARQKWRAADLKNYSFVYEWAGGV